MQTKEASLCQYKFLNIKTNKKRTEGSKKYCSAGLQSSFKTKKHSQAGRYNLKNGLKGQNQKRSA